MMAATNAVKAAESSPANETRLSLHQPQNLQFHTSLQTKSIQHKGARLPGQNFFKNRQVQAPPPQLPLAEAPFSYDKSLGIVQRLSVPPTSRLDLEQKEKPVHIHESLLPPNNSSSSQNPIVQRIKPLDTRSDFSGQVSIVPPTQATVPAAPLMDPGRRSDESILNGEQSTSASQPQQEENQVDQFETFGDSIQWFKQDDNYYFEIFSDRDIPATKRLLVQSEQRQPKPFQQWPQIWKKKASDGAKPGYTSFTKEFSSPSIGTEEEVGGISIILPIKTSDDLKVGIVFLNDRTPILELQSDIVTNTLKDSKIATAEFVSHPFEFKDETGIQNLNKAYQFMLWIFENMDGRADYKTGQIIKGMNGFEMFTYKVTKEHSILRAEPDSDRAFTPLNFQMTVSIPYSFFGEEENDTPLARELTSGQLWFNPGYISSFKNDGNPYWTCAPIAFAYLRSYIEKKYEIDQEKFAPTSPERKNSWKILPRNKVTDIRDWVKEEDGYAAWQQVDSQIRDWALTLKAQQGTGISIRSGLKIYEDIMEGGDTEAKSTVTGTRVGERRSGLFEYRTSAPHDLQEKLRAW